MRISNRVLTIRDGQGAVLMNVGTGRMLNLNRIGTIIWQQLRSGRLPKEISGQIATDFEISHQRASADVNNFLQQLQEQQLIFSSKSKT